MWEPGHLTTLWACTAYCRDSFTFTVEMDLGGMINMGIQKFLQGYTDTKFISEGYFNFFLNKESRLKVNLL
jgi:hypothetical protein